jgi:hypothetical protein
MSEKWKLVKTDASTSDLPSALKKSENNEKGKVKGINLKYLKKRTIKKGIFFSQVKIKRTRFKTFAGEVVKNVGKERKRVARPTIAFASESATMKRKNLAYYDKRIYNILKLRKFVEVIFFPL